MIKKSCLPILIFYLCLTSLLHAQDWMPDPNLRWFVRARLEIPDNIPMTPRDLLRLTDLEIRAKDVIANLQGLEYAVNLEFLNIKRSGISDLTPLAGLQNIRVLKFYDSNISDLTPVAGLVNLTYLNLAENNISDITPLDGLVNLKVLILGGNQIIDFVPIYGLVGIETLDLGEIPIDPEILQRLKPVDPPVICDIARDPILPRIENREYPSVFQACQDIINMPRLSREKGIAYHDLFFCRETFGFNWVPTPDGRKLIGDREGATIGTDRMRAQNPILRLLTSIEYYAAYDDENPDDEYPEDSPYFLRDESGNRLKSEGWDHFFLDFTHPAVQERVIQQAIEVAKCGVFDGIAIDHWTKGFEGYRTLEEEHAARDRIIQGIRDAVGDDFLILVTTNANTIPRTAEYINGLFMETTEDYEGGYTYAGLSHIESTLLWAEENLRKPQINCLAGRGDRNEPLGSPRNLQWMRLFTTMSLTHSDGSVMFTMGGHLDHPPPPPPTHLNFFQGMRMIMHRAYVTLTKTATTGTISGMCLWVDRLVAMKPKGSFMRIARGCLFGSILTVGRCIIGPAPNNRLSLRKRSPAGRAVWRINAAYVGRYGWRNLLKSKTVPTADVNGDGVVNILDLVIVANAFGETVPDLNGDGTVNILDLVVVANAFQ